MIKNNNIAISDLETLETKNNWYKHLSVYKNFYKKIIIDYWSGRFQTFSPIFLNKEGEPIFEEEKIKKSLKRIAAILEFNDEELFKRRLLSQLLLEGKAGYIIELAQEETQQIPFINIPSGIVVWSKVEGVWKKLVMIENTNQGTFPFIRKIEFGKKQDTIYYQLDEATFYGNEKFDGEDFVSAKKQEASLNKNKNITNHNFGFIRAGLFINRINHLNYNEGESELSGVEDFIFLKDESLSKQIIEIKTKTTSINISKGQGARIGNSDTRKSLKEGWEQDIETQFRDGLRINQFAANDNNTDMEIIPDTPQLEQLFKFDDRIAHEIELHLGIPISILLSDSGTNKHSLEVSLMDEKYSLKTKYKKKQFETIFSEILNKVLILDKKNNPQFWDSEVEGVKFEIVIEDLKKVIALLDKSDKATKYLSNKDFLKYAFGLTEIQSRQVVKDKDFSIKKSLSEFLSANNGNLPANANIIKDLEFIDYEGIKEKEQMQMQAKQENKESSKNEKPAKKNSNT